MISLLGSNERADRAENDVADLRSRLAEEEQRAAIDQAALRTLVELIISVEANPDPISYVLPESEDDAGAARFTCDGTGPVHRAALAKEKTP